MTYARVRGGILVALILMTPGCVPPRGGWDVDALIVVEPSIARLDGQRLGDMIPFPALDGDRIALIACRFAANQSVRVRGGGSQWPAGWGQAAVSALDRRVGRVELVLEAEHGSPVRARPDIEIVTIEAVGGEGPNGLGDTLSECDVSPIAGSAQGASPAYRGLLTAAEIRMRRAQLDMTGQVQDATAEEWVGALMHELAHALGFPGHAALGNSILVRDETLIRAAGRRALRGESVPDETLEALYRLRPGQRLGTRSLKVEGASWLNAIREFDRNRSAAGSPSAGLFSSVGDQAARIVWRYADGSQLGVRFPHWRSELRSGATITLMPDRATRQWIEVSTRLLE